MSNSFATPLTLTCQALLSLRFPRQEHWSGLPSPSPGRKTHWSRNWQSTPVFLPEKFHGQRSLAGYSPWGCKKVGHDLATKQQHMYNYLEIHSFKIVWSLMPSTGLLDYLLFPWEYLFENTKLPYNL